MTERAATMTWAESPSALLAELAALDEGRAVAPATTVVASHPVARRPATVARGPEPVSTPEVVRFTAHARPPRRWRVGRA